MSRTRRDSFGRGSPATPDDYKVTERREFGKAKFSFSALDLPIGHPKT